MFNAIPKEVTRRLWQHQTDALVFAIDHLNRFDSTCLIRMPTGTGKTGVIGCLSRLSNSGTTLVLTPWANLREQMIFDLTTGFWQRIGAAPKTLEISSMFPSNAETLLKSKAPQ